MKKRTKFCPAAAIALVWLAGLLAGCGNPKIAPLRTPENAQPPPAPEPTPAPKQVQLEPPPPPVGLKPLPAATKRVAVLVTERIGQAESSRRDPESESILAEAILSAGGELGLEVVKRGTYDEILERDFESLIQKGLDENAQVFNNLLQAGVDYFAMGEVGASELVRDLGGGKTMAERYSVHAGVTMVRTDDATATAAGNADADAKALREAKTKALREAARRMVDALRDRPEKGLLTITITVTGLSEFAQAERIQKKIRELEGVIWSRDLRFSSAQPGIPGGVARYELAWSGAPEELRSRIQALDVGVSLLVTRIEGNRWNYQVAEKRSSPEKTPGTPEKERTEN